MKNGLIYCYTYNLTNEKYIGQTINLEKRKKEHYTEYRCNQRFHNLLRKHFDDFILEILEDNIPIELLNDREKYWIKYYNTYEGEGFNLTPGGDGGFQACAIWWKEHPDEQKELIQKIQPLAAQAAKEWRKQNPELEKKRLKNLHQKGKEWRDNNPDKVQENILKAQLKAKEWREQNPEKFVEFQIKGSQKNSKKVKCLNTNEIFQSASEAGRIKNIPASNISGCCRGIRKSAGKDSEGNKLIWRYINDID